MGKPLVNDRFAERAMSVLKVISAIVALLFWFLSFFVWKYFDHHRSTIAQPGAGRTYPLSTHGSVVYLTAGEHYFLYGLIGSGAFFFLLAAGFYCLRRREP